MNLVVDFAIGLGGYMLRHWLGDVITKYILAPLLRPILRLLRGKLVKTSEHLVLWQHYKNKAQDEGHKQDHTVCYDGACATIKS